MSLKAILAACLILASTCHAGNVAEVERILMEAAESPDSQRLMGWLYSLNHRDGHLELPKDTKDLVACEICTDALNIFLALLRPPVELVTLDELNQALKVCGKDKNGVNHARISDQFCTCTLYMHYY